MNTTGGAQNFNISLTTQQLRRDAQQSIAQFNKIGQAAMSTGNQIDRGFNSMSKNVTGAIQTMTTGVKTAMADMAKSMLGITALLSSGAFLKSLIDESKEFTKEMKVVSTISQDVADDLQGYKDKVLTMCQQIAIAPETAAQALYQINSAGHLGADGLKVLEVSAKAAIGGVTETATAADAITTVLNAYKMSANDAEKVSDMLFTTVRLGKTNMEQLGHSISQVAPIAAQFGVSIDQVLAMIAELTKQGVPTATAIRQISMSILACTQSLGDGAFQTRTLLEAFQEVADKANGSENALKADLGNVNALRGVLAATGKNAEETAYMMEELQNATGAAESAFEKLNQGATAETRKLKNNFLKEFQGLGDGMNRTLASLAGTLNKAFETGDMQTMISVLKDLIITYGLYKAIIITVTALNKVYQNVLSQVAYQKTLATAAQKSLTTAEAMGAVVTSNLKRAWQALTAAIEANQFALAVAAIAAVAYGVYKFCTYESEAVKQAKAVDAAVASQTKQYGEEMNALDDVNRRLKAATKGSEEWTKAKNDAVRQFGKYDSTLAAEIDRVGNLTTSYDKLTQAIRTAMAAKALQKFEESSSPDEDIDKILADLNATLDKGTMYRGDGTAYNVSGALAQQIRKEMAQYAASGGKTKLSPKVSEYLTNTTMDNTKSHTGTIGEVWHGNSMMYNLIQAGVKQSTHNQGRNAVLDRYGLNEQQKNAILNGTVTADNPSSASVSTQSTIKTTAERVKEMISKSKTETNAKELDKLKDEMKDMLDKGDIDTGSQDYKDLKAAYESLKKRFTGSSTATNSGKTKGELQAEQTAAQKKYNDVELEQQAAHDKAMRDQQRENEQQEINLMADGQEKRKRQRELDAQIELDDLNDKMQDQLKAIISGEQAKFDAQEEVNEKTAAANGNKHYARKTFSTGEVNVNSLSAGDEVSTEGAGNLSQDAVTQMNTILAMYQRFQNNVKAIRDKELDDNAQMKYNEYLREFGDYVQKRQAIIDIANVQMQQAETEGERLSISAQMEKDLSDLDQEVNKKTSVVAQLFANMSDKSVASMRKLETQGKKALEFLTKGEWNEDTGKELGMSKETFETLRKSPAELEKIQKALKDIKKEADAAENGFTRFGNGLKKIFKEGNDSKKLQDGLNDIAAGVSQVNQVANVLSSNLGQLGEALGSDTLSGIADGISVASDAMNGAMQGAQAGAVFGPWGAAAGAAIGLVGSLGSALAKLHDAKYEKRIEALQDQIDVLEDSYEDLSDAIDKAFSKDASNLIDQQNTLLEQQKVLIQQQINEEKQKKNVDEDRIKDWEDQIKEIDKTIAENKDKAIDAIFGEDVQSAIENFADAYASMFDDGITKAKASKDIVKSMIKSMIVEAMKADLTQPMQRLREMMQNFWSDNYIDTTEREALNQYAENMMADLEEQYGWADGYFTDSTSQSSSKGGFTTMSQETGDELNGRFTSIQMDMGVVKTNTIEINENLRSVAARAAEQAAAIEEIRGLQLLAIDHLQTISKNTHELYEMNERLQKIEKYTSRI